MRRGNADPNSDRQKLLRLLFEANELTDVVEGIPIRYGLANELERLRARGHLLIHLMTIADLDVPAPVQNLWQSRIESVRHVIAALGNPPNSEAAPREWEVANRLLKNSADLVPALRAALR